MQELNLTPTSFIVLGLLAQLGEATPYDLKRVVASSIGNFWSVPHSALYAEPERLAGGGYLERTQEPEGLRRKRYTLTDRGRQALEAWKRTPTGQLPELRDESLLKLFFEADPRPLAAEQRDAHREKLAAYERQAGHDPGDGPRGPWRALRAGLAHEREWVDFWAALAGDDEPGGPAGSAVEGATSGGPAGSAGEGPMPGSADERRPGAGWTRGET